MNQERIRYLTSLPDGVIHQRSGALQELLVTKEEERIQMVFESDRSSIIQAEMEIDKPFSLYDGFTQALTLGLVWRPQPKKSLLIGFGGGRIPTVLHHHFPDLTIECAEIDKDVVEVAQEFFFAPIDTRVRVSIQDGIECFGDNVFDAVMIDAFDSIGNTPNHLSTPGFYRRCCEHLVEDGVVTVNIMPTDDSFIEKVQHFESSFDFCFFVNIADEGTVVLIGGRGDEPSKHKLVERAKKLESECKFQHPFSQHVKNLQPIHKVAKLRRKRRR